MTTRNRLFTVLSSLLMVFAVSTFALAQETTTKQDDSVQQKEGKRGFGRHGGRGGKFGRFGGDEGRGKGFGHRGGGMRGGMRGGFHMLNLSEEQKTQLKNLHETFRTSNEAAFKETHTLFQQKRDKTITAEGEARLQELHKQMKAAHEGLRASSLNLLTADQKTQLETMKAERKLKMEERRKLREQKRAAKPAGTTKEN